MRHLILLFVAAFAVPSYGQSPRKSILSELKSDNTDKSSTYLESGVLIRYVDKLTESNSRVNFIQLSFENALMSGGSGIIMLNNSAELEAFKLELASLIKHIEQSPKTDKAFGHVYFYNFDLNHVYIQTENYRYYCKIPFDSARKIYDHLSGLSLN
jgi:hypothetical protein